MSTARELYVEMGGNTQILWLIEVQTIETAKKYHDHIDDLVRDPKDDMIIYFHESGSLNQSATFKSWDEESMREAVKFLVENT